MRLIDADEMLVDESEAYMNAQLKVQHELTKRINEIVHKKIQMLIMDTPTVEAEPVLRGRWVIENDGTVMHCEVCGWAYEYYGGLEEEYNYCPHCGARMEE